MEQTYTIEEVTTYSSDVHQAIERLVKQLSDDAQSLETDALHQLLKSDATTLLVARDKISDEILGMITLVSYRIPYKMKGILEDLVVDQDHRGRGIGKALLNHAIEKAKEKGVTSLMLTSRPSRVEANKLYQSLGFIQHETNVYHVKL